MGNTAGRWGKITVHVWLFDRDIKIYEMFGWSKSEKEEKGRYRWRIYFQEVWGLVLY